MGSRTPDINQILALPRYQACGPYGADLGRFNKIDEPAKLYLQRVSFVDQCYDRGGAYWGSPADLWCAFAGDDNDAIATMIFVRANSRQQAKDKVIEVIDERTGEKKGWCFKR